jgi:hypothetical protein
MCVLHKFDLLVVIKKMLDRVQEKNLPPSFALPTAVAGTSERVAEANFLGQLQAFGPWIGPVSSSAETPCLKPTRVFSSATPSRPSHPTRPPPPPRRRRRRAQTPGELSPPLLPVSSTEARRLGGKDPSLSDRWSGAPRPFVDLLFV